MWGARPLPKNEINQRPYLLNQMPATPHLVERKAPLVECGLPLILSPVHLRYIDSRTKPYEHLSIQARLRAGKPYNHITIQPYPTMFNPTEFSALRWLTVPLLIFARYFLISLAFYSVFYVWKRRTLLYRKIQSKFPKDADLRREIGFSALTSVIFAAMSWLCLGTPLRAYTQFYTDIHQHSLLYLVGSIPVILLIHDTYFYWIHRLMHLPWFYRRVHLTHHKSVNPSPWAAYAFHPVEAVLEGGILPLLLFCIPMHPINFFGFITLMLWFNVYGHLGYELFSRKVYEHPIGRWLNSSVYHNLHHERFQGNYGLYFTLWDRLMGTLRPDSTEKIDAVHRQMAQALQQKNAAGKVRFEKDHPQIIPPEAPSPVPDEPGKSHKATTRSSPT